MSVTRLNTNAGMSAGIIRNRGLVIQNRIIDCVTYVINKNQETSK